MCMAKFVNIEPIGRNYTMKNRDELIQEKIAEKDRIERMQLRGIQKFVYEVLTKDKAFHPDEIQVNQQFVVKLPGTETRATIDFIISLEKTNVIVVLCVSAGIVSWERYAIAFARAIADYQIPYAVITDGEEARISDVLSNSSRLISVQDLFTREDAYMRMSNFQKVTLPEKRRDMERRIILAFEAIKCRV